MEDFYQKNCVNILHQHKKYCTIHSPIKYSIHSLTNLKHTATIRTMYINSQQYNYIKFPKEAWIVTKRNEVIIIKSIQI